MAEKDDAPKFNARHRIVGAIIVVALAVILVPMILEENEPPAELKGISEIPARSDGDKQVVVTPVADLAKDAAETKDAKVPPPTAAVAPVELPPVSKPAAEEPKPVARTEIAKSEPLAEKPATAATKGAAEKAAAKATKVTKGWVVQVGVYANPENAARVRDKLKTLDLAVKEERITLDGSKAVRLRVGPYRDRAAAVKAQARIQKDAGVQGVVLAYP
jgi:DedD protein